MPCVGSSSRALSPPARIRRDMTAPRPGVPAGAQSYSRLRLTCRRHPRQLRDARASFQVADGRMTASALAFSTW